VFQFRNADFKTVVTMETVCHRSDICWNH